MPTKEEKRETRRKQELNRILKKEYELNKQKLLHLERDNYGHIILIRTQDGWYKMVSHSVLLFLYYVVPVAQDKLDTIYKPPRMTADNDFRYKAPIGVISFKSLEKLEKIIFASGATREKVEGADEEWIRAYELDHKMSEDDFWALEKKETELWNKANTIITPKAVFPNLGVDLRETSVLFYNIVRKLDTVARETIGNNMMDLIKRIDSGLIQAEKGYITWESFFSFAPKLLCELGAQVILLSNLRIIDRNVITRMAENVSKIENDLLDAKNKYKKTTNGAKS